MTHKPSNYHYRAEIYKQVNGRETCTFFYASLDEPGLNSIYEEAETFDGEYTRIEVYMVKGAVETFKDLI